MTETRKLGSIFNPFSDSFSVDGFLSRKTATIGLEKLRDDLGVYLKILRSAMIELINEDYAGKNSLALMKGLILSLLHNSAYVAVTFIVINSGLCL